MPSANSRMNNFSGSEFWNSSKIFSNKISSNTAIGAANDA